jgi:hypothetical protein
VKPGILEKAELTEKHTSKELYSVEKKTAAKLLSVF